MKAVGYTSPGPSDVFETFELDTPTPQGRDLCVEVHAVSVNPIDTKVRSNRPPLDDGPGLVGFDAVGVVSAVGDSCELFSVGDRVWYAGSYVRRGTNAESHLVDERIVGRAPVSASDAEAAAMPLTTLTAWEGLFDRMRVDQPIAGEADVIVVIGGAGGVGSMAIQLLRAMTDLTVIATASRPESVAWCVELGAHHVINHHESIVEQIDALGLGAPSFVFSTTHTRTYLAQIAELMAPQGRFGFIDRFPDFDISLFFPKSISIHPELMFTRPTLSPADMTRQHEILDAAATLVDDGSIRSTMTESFGAITPANLARAHDKVATGTTIGKVVLEGF